MPDRRRRRSTQPRPNSLIAAAQVLISPNEPVRRVAVGSGAGDGWQQDAWDYYDSIGELRFGVSWIANAMSRVNLAAAMPASQPGDEPVLIDLEDPATTEVQRRAVEIVAQIAGGPSGQGQLLSSFGIHLSVAGIGWLVVEPSLEDPTSDAFASWRVVASDEIRDNQGSIEIRVGDRLWRDLHPNAVVVKVWRPHPRKSYQPDAPTRGVLSILREIDLLQRHILATAQSRLAGAGILAMPSEAVFPPGQGPQLSQGVDPDDENTTAPEDGFIETLIDAMTAPLTDRGSAASVVPLVVKVPGEWVDKIKHLSFATPFDARVQELLEAAIRRLALGLDIPPEILTGTSGMNHWGAWQVAEEAVTLHIEPLSETVVHALTVGFLRPALIAEGLDPEEVVVWYDTSDLRTRPDRSKSALEAYDRNELSGTAMLRELGLSPDDYPTEDERRERILLAIAKAAPNLAPAMLAEVGILNSAAVARIDAGDAAPAALPTPRTAPDRAMPEPADGTVTAALTAACDVLVRRALERAGSRLRSAAGKGQPGGAAAISCDDPTILHTRVDATAHADLGALLDGAWTMIPEIATRYGVDMEELTRTLDTYTRALLAAKMEHQYGRLAVALGAP